MALTLTHVGVIQGSGSPNYLNGARALAVCTISGTEYAFVVSDTDDHLSIFDVSTPSSPSLAGTFGGAGSPNYMNTPYGVDVATISGTEYAFVVSYADDALTVVNVSTPGSPSLAGLIRLPINHLDGPYDVQIYTVDGTEYAFVANAIIHELAIFDVSTPATPTYHGSISGAGSPNYLGAPRGVFVTTIGGTEYAFLACVSDSCLTIINVGNPAIPSHTATISGAGSPNYLAAAHNVYVLEIDGTEYAFVTTITDDSMSIFDVSTPGSPSLAGVIRGQGSPNYMNYPQRFMVIALSGTEFAFVPANYDDALNAIDVSTPSAPSRTTGHTGAGSPNYLDQAMDAVVADIGGTKHVLVASSGNDDALTIFEIGGLEATVATYYYNGAGPSSASLTNLRFKAADDNTQDTNDPVVIPVSGNYYTYWKQIAPYAETAPGSGINNVKFYTDGTIPWTGVTIKGAQVTNYDQASGTEGRTGDNAATSHTDTPTMTDISTYTSGSPLSLTGSIGAETGKIIDGYLLLQGTISSSATTGVSATETFTWSYDET